MRIGFAVAAAAPIVAVAQRTPVLVPLTRRFGEISYGDHDVMRSHFVAKLKVGIGDNQNVLDVVFDTSSGQVILPTKGCTDKACKQRTLYDDGKSGKVTLADPELDERVTADLDMVDFDRGITTAHFVKDDVCFGAKDFNGHKKDACVKVDLLAATEYSDKPWLQLPYDGVMGLGMKGLSIQDSFNYLFNWQDEMEDGCEGETCPANAFSHKFAFYFPPNREGDGEIAIGGHNADHLASPLTWVPIDRPQDGYWLIKLQSVSVGDNTIKKACPLGRCWGLIDSSCSRLGVPKDVFPTLFRSMKLSTPADGDCRRAAGPDLRIQVAGMEDELTLRAGDYGVLASETCVPEIVPLREMPRDNVYVLGEGFLRRYYTVFDWGKKRVGFGLAKGS